ncbi:NAD(+) diphosphatase [Bertholletia excelsa]
MASLLFQIDQIPWFTWIIEEELTVECKCFAPALRASLSNWRLKGKKAMWLKLLQEQADLVPIAIQEGFNYHHAEPDIPSHQIGIAGFVMNDNREAFQFVIIVVKEKSSCSCLGVWKLPTGCINKVLVLHPPLVAFEKSDLMLVCMLKPLSSKIITDEKEIQAAKYKYGNQRTRRANPWSGKDRKHRKRVYMTKKKTRKKKICTCIIKKIAAYWQPFYREDHMSRRIIEACMETRGGCCTGFVGHQLTSKFDGNLSSYLYCNDKSIV